MRSKTRSATMPERLLSAALSLVLAVGLCPAIALADDLEPQAPAPAEEAQIVTDDAANVGDNVVVETVVANQVQEGDSQLAALDEEPAAEGARVKIEVYTGIFAALHMYTYDTATGTVGETDVLADATITSGTFKTYECSLPVGFYQVTAASSDGTSLGTTVLEVKDIELNELNLYCVNSVKASNSGWVEGVDYVLDVTLEMADGTPRVFTLGTYQGGSVIALKGDTLTLKATPTEARSSFLPAQNSVTVTTNTNCSVSCQEAVLVTFNVPEGSTLSVGTLTKYYIYSYMEVGEPTAAEDGTVNYQVAIPKSKDHYYRVQHPNGVTYWSYDKWSAASTVTVTAAQLHIGDATVTKSTVDKSFTNRYDVGNIYLNINSAGCLDMQQGESFEVNVWRNWYAIESYMNAKVAIPDAHYQVIDVNGNPSDLVTVTPDANNTCVANLTANGNGTALVLVTYDAMTYRGGMGSTDTHDWFSASWPEFTGVFVVNVGDTGSVESNMVLSRLEASAGSTLIDSEFDILYYVGSEGASYSFKPAEGVNISVARSTVGSTMTFSGFTTEGVTTAADGTVTVSGLTSGRHIIKAEKDGVVDYQVVTARGVSYELQDANGNALAEDAEIHAGDTIKVQFSGLVNPREKLSGAYNFNATVYYMDADGTVSKSVPGGNFGVYDFSGDPAKQVVTVKIPKYFAGDTYTLDGVIKMGGFAGVHHRGITYANGTNPQFDAPTVNANLGAMPTLSIPVAESAFYDCTIALKDDQGQTVDLSNATVKLTDSDGEAVSVSETGAFRVPAGTFNYKVYASGYNMAQGQIVVGEAGTFEIALETGVAGAWDGITTTEPAQIDGVYQISTGAELAWLAAQTNAKTLQGFTAVQTADIHLGGYPWTSICKTTGYKIQYDAQGHSISGLNAEYGVFYKATTADSYIKNLTVNGSVTSTNNEAAGIIAYLNRGTVENCVNNATVTAIGSGKNSFGGIAGKVEYGTIKNCVNNGTITAEGTYVGGIVGYGYDDTAKITGCYNTAAIAGDKQVGGIIGYNGYAGAIENCYNTGAISATEKAGGIVGDATKGSYTNCYSTGVVTGGKAFVGSAGASATFSNDYCLAEDDYATVVSEGMLRSVDLGEAYKSVCNGYPALAWQTGTAAHVPNGQETVVAPTCVEYGYTNHGCENCDGYRDSFVDPLGHSFCEHMVADDTCTDCVFTDATCVETGSFVRTCRREGCTETKTDIIAAKGHVSDPAAEEVLPAYKQCVCSVCGVSYVSWNDDRLQYMDLPTWGIANVTMSDNGSYPWVYNETSKALISSNQKKSSTTSATDLTFTLLRPATLSFGYAISSESGYDKFTITYAAIVDGQETGTVTVANAISGSSSASCEAELEAGTYTLHLSYAKDSSSDSGTDTASISNLKIAPEPITFSVAASYDGIQQPVKVGDTVTVNFTASSQDAMAGIDATIGYDKDVLELKSITGGEGIANFNSDVEKAFFNFLGEEISLADGKVIATATFEAKAQADATVVTLAEGAIVAVAGDPTTEYVPTVVATEGLEILGNVQKGDVNCTGTINIVDAQVCYDIATFKYANEGGSDLLAKLNIPGYSKATIAWAANVNDDDAIDSIDAFAIQYFTHYGTFGA